MLRISNLAFELTEPITAESAAERAGIKLSDVQSFHLHKCAIDARKKSHVHYVCAADFEVKDENKYKNLKNAAIVSEKAYVFPKSAPLKKRPVIIGSGPAGLFAALFLAENGHRPIVFERGEEIDARVLSVERFQKDGVLNPESNIQFGEGGAGTFSDGKLTTGIKNIRCRAVLERFVQFGAPKEILYLAKPHIGTDLLRGIVKNMREYIMSRGGEFHFSSCVSDFLLQNGRISGVVANEAEYACDSVILAVGHSARDTVSCLYNLGTNMIAKPFSVGARIEHLQSKINESQYGKSAQLLGAADYKLSCHLENGRGVYTFCMCPGGSVVCASSESGGVVTNGMSNHARNGKNANAALLVGVSPADFSSNHPLAGMEFQREIEQKAFFEAKSTYHPTAQTVGDFLRKKPSVGAKAVVPTCLPDVHFGSLDSILPNFVCDSMRVAIRNFDRKLNGFADESAVLTGPETRSSSPVRILRDETFQSNIKGLYPCGEGAGYAGGIISAATDGIACAEALILNQK